MKPLRNEIIVKKQNEEAKTESGIVLPDAQVPKQTIGVVIAVGKDTKELKPNDRVLFGEHAYIEIIVGKTEVLFMPESSVLAIL